MDNMHAPYPVFQGKSSCSTHPTNRPRNSLKEKKNIRSDQISSPSAPKNLLGALASTTSSIVAERASGANSRAALTDVVADVVVAAADLTVNGSLVLGTSDALEVGGLGLLAGGRVDGAALGNGDLAVVAGALAADLDFGTGELLLDVLVNTGLLGCKENMLVVFSTRFLVEGRHTGVGERSFLGVEVALGLLGDDHGVLTLVFGSHCD